MSKTPIVLVILVMGCGAAKPSFPMIEYQGKPLEFSNEYSIDQVGDGSMVFTIAAPDSEKILVNLYEPDGTLGVTLYQGKGGVVSFSLRMKADKLGYQFKKGGNTIVVFGERGKAQFNATVR